MSASITAKVRCQAKVPVVDGSGQVALTFVADYDDGRNKEWSLYTPSLNLQMTVRGDIAERFEPGQTFLLAFTPEET